MTILNTGEGIMLNFEEELQKFKPSMEVDDIEESFYREDLNAGEPAERERRRDREESDR